MYKNQYYPPTHANAQVNCLVKKIQITFFVFGQEIQITFTLTTMKTF